MEELEDEMDLKQEKSNAKDIFLPKKPRNNLDYLNYSSETHYIWKFSEDIKNHLQNFHFDTKILQEITQICIQYKDVLTFNKLLPIVVYKIIKKYNFPFTKTYLIKDFHFNISNYLKNANKVQILLPKISFEESVFSHITHVINKLIDLSKTKPMLFKIKRKKILKKKQKDNKDNSDSDLKSKMFLKLTNQLFASSGTKQMFLGLENDLNIIKIQCRKFIYNTKREKEERKNNYELEEETKFSGFFSRKIPNTTLSLCLVRYFMKENNISINLKILNKLFSVSLSSISKGIALIKQFVTLNNDYNI